MPGKNYTLRGRMSVHRTSSSSLSATDLLYSTPIYSLYSKPGFEPPKLGMLHLNIRHDHLPEEGDKGVASHDFALCWSRSAHLYLCSCSLSFCPDALDDACPQMIWWILMTPCTLLKFLCYPQLQLRTCTNPAAAATPILKRWLCRLHYHYNGCFMYYSTSHHCPLSVTPPPVNRCDT